MGDNAEDPHEMKILTNAMYKSVFAAGEAPVAEENAVPTKAPVAEENVASNRQAEYKTVIC